MPKLHLRRRALKWGNGYGIRLTKAEMTQLGADPGAPLEVDLEPGLARVDLSKLHMIRGTRDASRDHTELSTEP